MAAIRTEKLCKTYSGGLAGSSTTAVRDLNLEVNEGEIFGFLGPNGAGKTSTIHLLLNLTQPTGGMAWLFDRPVTETEVHRRLGYLPESIHVPDYYRGAALLEFYAKLLALETGGIKQRIAELLALVKLEDAAEKTVAKYSKGMLQRLGFAQAMLHDPDLLVLDEPTASMDPVGRKEFRDILLQLKQRGKTIFISSHILSEVESICDRVAILQNGELKRIGSLQELSASRNTRIVIKNPPPAVFQALAATTAQMTLVQGLATIRCDNDVLCKTVEDILAQHQVEIVRREAEAQSLEEIFFSAITPPPKI